MTHFPGDPDYPNRTMEGVIGLRAASGSDCPVPRSMIPMRPSSAAVRTTPPNTYSRRYVGRSWVDQNTHPVCVVFCLPRNEDHQSPQGEGWSMRLKFSWKDPFCPGSRDDKTSEGVVRDVPVIRKAMLLDPSDADEL